MYVYIYMCYFEVDKQKDTIEVLAVTIVANNVWFYGQLVSRTLPKSVGRQQLEFGMILMLPSGNLT